ncbi:MAG: thioredoxin family protein [Eubacteriales bacterium]
MALFNFGKKKEEKVTATCGCGSQCGISDIENARIIVLGACCKKSSDTFANVKQAALELGIKEDVANIGDVTEIAKYGVMSTPALVVDGKVVSMGKVLEKDEVVTILQKVRG